MSDTKVRLRKSEVSEPGQGAVWEYTNSKGEVFDLQRRNRLRGRDTGPDRCRDDAGKPVDPWVLHKAGSEGWEWQEDFLTLQEAREWLAEWAERNDDE